MKSVELFAGAGGLGLGISLAGFEHLAVVEWDKWACDTIRDNQQRGFPLVADWAVAEEDVRQFDLSALPEGLALIAGGPPCQPFSMGGKHRAYNDDRDMFPTAIDAIRKLKPRAFIIENVKGLTRPNFANYYQYILLQLEFPEVARRASETWEAHFHRLQAEKTSGRPHAGGQLAYNVVPTLVNAADFGIPQKRERIFIVGFRDDQGIAWSFPRDTHSFEALLHDQWVSGEYWERHELAKRKRPRMPESLAPRVERLRQRGAPLFHRPWRTVRDALQGLPDPEKTTQSSFHNHQLQAGARPYPGHTGSPLDLPAKTLKAGDHGVPGGENMMVKDNGDVRYFTVRESARLQTFPDGYVFHGTWSETMRQLGNAVPVGLAHLVAASVAEKLIEH
ncbi:MAG: DNA (cytosine-5-)-methyltransferase [Deltaproteobacteria bacterium]|nr:DNA (cytosine-5-)-methyltransferase [Deltaproteobacteria bacterium]